MPLATLLLQIVIPLALVGALFVIPGYSLAATAIPVLAVGSVLLAMSLVFLWAVPPTWVRYLYAALWLIAALHLVRRAAADQTPILPAGAGEWWIVAASALVLLASLPVVGIALYARTPSGDTPVEMGPPFRSGSYLVAHGGSREIMNVHLKTLDGSQPRFTAWRGQSSAVDFLGRGRFRLTGPIAGSTDPGDYPIFGATVVAPCDGEVLAAESERPDLPVPEMDSVNKLGNHVILQCGDYQVVLAHLREGSIRVSTGQIVTEGTILGEVGNSGNSSQPHLHMHVQRGFDPERPIAGVPVPFAINGRYLVRNDLLRLTGS